MKSEKAVPASTPVGSSALLTVKEAAVYLRVAEDSLPVWICTKRYPALKVCHVGRAVRFRIADLDAFVASCSGPRKAA